MRCRAEDPKNKYAGEWNMNIKTMRLTVLLLYLMLSLAGCAGLNGSEVRTDRQTAGSISEENDGTVTTDDGSPAEGRYQVSVKLEGGSGKASVASPTYLSFKDGEWTLELRWSSSDYDYMIVDDERFFPVSTEGGSLFEIPLSEPAGELSVTADTTAMSAPHEIEYRLIIGPAGEDETEVDKTEQDDVFPVSSEQITEWRDRHIPSSEVEFRYAAGLTIDNYEDGSSLVMIKSSGDAFFLLPEGTEPPDDLPGDITVLNIPLHNIYLSTSGAMDMFRAMDALSAVRFTSTNVTGWDMPEVIDAMDNGDILYVGSYSAPDFERLLAEGCELAVENTMIYHAPEAGEQLEHLGIPILVDYTSYENEPLGRCEWIKLYGLLCDREAEAEEAFEEQEELFLNAASGEPTGRSVAFFYITQSGLINVRRSYDYLARMIGMAGGEYIFPDLGSPEANSPNISMQMEEFYAGAKDADILIYNGSMEGEIYTVEDLTSMNPLFEKFRAVENGDVFCARKSMYQASMEMGTILSDFRAMLTGEDDKLVYFYRLR